MQVTGSPVIFCRNLLRFMDEQSKPLVIHIYCIINLDLITTIFTGAQIFIIYYCNLLMKKLNWSSTFRGSMHFQSVACNNVDNSSLITKL